MKKVEVEGGEFMIQSKEGHYAIIPARDRNKVMKLVEQGCDDCINEYIKNLPQSPGYADNGGVYDAEGSFNKAFAKARKDLGAGKTFSYKGQIYTTDLASDNPRPSPPPQRVAQPIPPQGSVERSIGAVTGQRGIPATVASPSQSRSQPAVPVQTPVAQAATTEPVTTTQPVATPEPINTPEQTATTTQTSPQQDRTTAPAPARNVSPFVAGANAGLSEVNQGIISGSIFRRDNAVQAGNEPITYEDIDFFDYEEPENVQKIRQFQAEKGIPVTGKFDLKTKEAYYGKNFEAEQKYNEAVAARQRYQDAIRKQSGKIKPGDFLGMNPEIEAALKRSNVKDISHCIGGVCYFLDQKVDPGLFSGKGVNQGFMKGTYFSNTKFEEEHQKEGWQKHTDFRYTTPDVGDIIRLKYVGKDMNHAMLVVGFEKNNNNPDLSKITILDNAGGKNARVRTMTMSDFKTRFSDNKRQFQFNFYRRTRFGDVDTAKSSKALKEYDVPVPEEFQDNRFNYDGKKTAVHVKGQSQYPNYVEYINGLNNIPLSDYNNIPEDHLQKLLAISALLPINESELGTGDVYKAESAFPAGAKLYRMIKSGTSMSKPLSVGLSQINPEMLSPRIKDKYFKEKSDNQIQRMLIASKQLQGTISFEIMVDRYNMYRNSDGRLYGNDPSKFWYALINSWQYPNKALIDKGRQNLEQLNWDYSNNILENMQEINVKLR